MRIYCRQGLRVGVPELADVRREEGRCRRASFGGAPSVGLYWGLTYPRGVGMTDEQQAAVKAATERAEESLRLLDGIPVRDTAAARSAMTEMRLGVLVRFHADVRAALGEEAAA
jgi:hypothetical protein